jgi:hypothetical protein
MKFLGICFDFEDLIPGFRTGVIGEERNQKFAWIDGPTLSEWVSGNHILKLGRCANDDVDAKTEAPLYRILDALGQRSEVSLFRSENDIATLHVSFRILQFE